MFAIEIPVFEDHLQDLVTIISVVQIRQQTSQVNGRAGFRLNNDRSNDKINRENIIWFISNEHPNEVAKRWKKMIRASAKRKKKNGFFEIDLSKSI